MRTSERGPPPRLLPPKWTGALCLICSPTPSTNHTKRSRPPGGSRPTGHRDASTSKILQRRSPSPRPRWPTLHMHRSTVPNQLHTQNIQHGTTHRRGLNLKVRGLRAYKGQYRNLTRDLPLDQGAYDGRRHGNRALNPGPVHPKPQLQASEVTLDRPKPAVKPDDHVNWQKQARTARVQ